MYTMSEITDKPRQNSHKKLQGDIRNRGRKERADRRKSAKPRRQYKQVFGPGMMVNHDTYGIGTVTSAFKWHICVQFHMLGATQTVQARELSFTREEQMRRRKIQGAIRHGAPVACTSEHLGKEVVHELLGFGVLLGVVGEDGFESALEKELGAMSKPDVIDEDKHRGKVLVCFRDNDYTNKADGEVLDPKELRVVVPREKTVDDKKRGRR